MFIILLSFAKDLLSNRGVMILELAFFRSFFNMISAIILVKVIYKQTFFSCISNELRGAMFARCASGMLGFLCKTTAPKFIPLGVLQVVTCFNMFSTAILACCWLGERIVCFEVAAMFVTLGGVSLLGVSKSQNEEQESDLTDFF